MFINGFFKSGHRRILIPPFWFFMVGKWLWMIAQIDDLGAIKEASAKVL
tara:strand:- start:5 stop:151 length:147 start_codon:yes stop_codon:yes gene_type:complete